jgi:hypothetical protein
LSWASGDGGIKSYVSTYSSIAKIANLVTEHLDEDLMVFLRAKFPKEVKAKQKENERAAGVDRYGDDFDKCSLM